MRNKGQVESEEGTDRGQGWIQYTPISSVALKRLQVLHVISHLFMV